MKRFDYNFSEYQAAFNKVAKKIIMESECEYDADQVSRQIDEAQVTYNKIQKILNCPEMIKSHAYLYALDMENVDECDRQKIDKLYDLGVARGVIDDTPEGEDASDETPDVDDFDCGDGNICGGPDDALTGQEMTPVAPKPATTSSAFTVLYSAIKDGQVKTGEYFSSATDQDAAKSDCISNLSPLGYSNIRVLGIEQSNSAVDFQNSTLDSLDEDDSKEYEAQETGDQPPEKQEQQEQSTEQADDGKEKKQEEKQDAQTPEDEKNDAGQAQDDSKQDAQQNDQGDGGDTEANGEDATQEKPENAENTEKQAEKPENAEKELTPTEKSVLRDEYVGMFKAELQATKLQKSVNDMNNKEKADFWNKIVEKWKKQDPEEFMSHKEIEKLNDTVIKVS